MIRPNRRTISVLLVVVALIVSIGPAMGAAAIDAPSVQNDTDEQDTTNETDENGDFFDDEEEDAAGEEDNGTDEQDTTNESDGDFFAGDESEDTAGDESEDTADDESEDTADDESEEGQRLDELLVEHITVEQLTIENIDVPDEGDYSNEDENSDEGDETNDSSSNNEDDAEDCDSEDDAEDGDSEDDTEDSDSEDDTEDSDSEDDTEDSDSEDNADTNDGAHAVDQVTVEQLTITNLEINVSQEDLEQMMADDDGETDVDADNGDEEDEEADDDADNAEDEEADDDADDAEDEEADDDADDAEDEEDDEADADSFEVSNFDAPDEATIGDTLEVSAEVSNPNDDEVTQDVELRLEGDVIERQNVTLEGDESDTVTFEIDTEGLEPGDFIHGILSEDFGEVDEITLNEADDDEEDVEEDDEEGDEEDEEEAEPNATVTFEDQETDGSTVTVQNVNVSEGGFVTIHDSSLLEGATFDSVVGTSEFLEPGEHEDVEVHLFDEETVPGAEFDQDALEDDQTLIAMPHLDTNDNETYDFIETEGEEDGPYTEDGEAVIDDAEITVTDGDDEEEEADGDDEADDEEDDAANATLDVQDQSGDGETLTVGEASADEDFRLVANYDGETSESDEFNAVEERLDFSLELDPAIEEDTTVEVAILAAEDDEVLTSQQIEYDVEENGNETEAPTDDGEDDEEDAPTEAAVTFEEQETDGNTVTVDSVSLPDGGFVTIHDSSLFDEVVVDSVVGSSEYLEPGEHEDVEVQLYDEETVPGAEFDQDALEDDQTLIAMPHQDTNDNESYDFVETEGEEDGPYTEDDVPIIDDAEITVTDGDADTIDDETDGDMNETDGTTNETDGDATGVDGNETAALLA